MKSKSTVFCLFAVTTLAISYAHAQSTWTGVPGAEWGTASNWDTDPVFPNAIDAVANINTALTVNLTTPLTSYTFGTLSATLAAAGNVVIGNNTVTTDILTAATSSGVPVINAGTGATLFFYANLEGSQGFNKTGAGKLTYRFNYATQAYTGNITIAGGTLGMQLDGSLGDAGNDIFIATGAKLLAEPGGTVASITLPATRTITLTGAQSQIGASTTHLIVAGDVTENVADSGLVKTDASKLTLGGTISYTGETRIAGGTLALAGSAALPITKALRFTGNSVHTFDLGETSQTVGSLLLDSYYLNNRIITNGNLSVVGNNNLSLGGGIGTAHNFTGLTSFTYDGSGATARTFNLNTGGSVGGTVELALANTGIGSNTIKVDQVLIGTSGPGADIDGFLATLRLGQANRIHADMVQLGGYRSGGTVNFNSGITSGTLEIRAEDGVSAMPEFVVGLQGSGSSPRRTGTLDLTGGSVDARIQNLVVGRRLAGSPIAVMTMAAGILEADQLLLADVQGTGFSGLINSTFNHNGGSVTAATVTMGKEAGVGSTPNHQINYNLNGGTLTTAGIQKGTGTFNASSQRNFILKGGTLINKAAADLSISGVTVTVSGITTTIVDSTVGQKVVLGGDVIYSARLNSSTPSIGTLQVDGDLDLSASPAFNIFDDAAVPVALPGGTKLVLIDYQDGSLTGTFAGKADGDTLTVAGNVFILDYNDPAYGGKAVTLIIPGAVSNFTTWALTNSVTGGPNGDSDNDGISNLVEYALALNPAASDGSPGTFVGNTLTFAKRAEAVTNGDVTYIIETSTDLGITNPWSPVTPTTNTGTTISYLLPSGPVKNFARFQTTVTP